MRQHELLSGETIDLQGQPTAVLAFIERLRSMAEDLRIDLRSFEEVLYGADNPLLDHERQPGRHVVTTATFADPAYHVMLDLLGRARERRGDLDMEQARARFTMRVSDVARQLGISESAVRQRIASHQLPAIKVGDTYLLDPQSVAAQRVLRRGPAPKTPPSDAFRRSTEESIEEAIARGELYAFSGKHQGVSLRVAHDGSEHSVPRFDQPGTARTIAGWTRAGVVTGNGDSTRFFELVPSSVGEVEELRFGGFVVRGRFRVNTTENNAKRAQRAFADFKVVVDIMSR